jgi:hypothetical protein
VDAWNRVRNAKSTNQQIMGPIPTSGGKFKYILTVSDHFTKYVEFFAMESTSAEETARKEMEYVCRHGVMESLLSDRGTNYQSGLINFWNY